VESKEATEITATPKQVEKLQKINFVKSPTMRTEIKNEDEKHKNQANQIQVVSEQKEKIYSSRYVPKHRVVHLDFKGAPPKLSYIKTILPLLRDAGATALLIEYEDMFPFWGPLKNVSAKNCFSIQDIQKIQVLAAQNNLVSTLIPSKVLRVFSKQVFPKCTIPRHIFLNAFSQKNRGLRWVKLG